LCREVSRCGSPAALALRDGSAALVSLAEGDGPGAAEGYRLAFARWQAVGAAYLAATMRVGLARAYLTLGDRDGASSELACARASFDRVGARPALARLDALGGESRLAARQGLTYREIEVIRLVAQGRTNKAIGRQLGLSPKTVDRHVS